MGFIFGNKSAKKAAKAAEEANKIERQKGELQAMRQRLEAIRNARSSYANIQQSAENQGVATSSVAEGGESSVVSQMGANLSFLDKMGFLTEQAEKWMAKARKYQQKANFWSAVDNFIIGVANTAASAGAFSDIELKNDVEYLFTRPDGLDVISYTIDNKFRIGVIAQQVSIIKPEAHIPNFQGTRFAGVDYGKI